jgi:hypothetical protein
MKSARILMCLALAAVLLLPVVAAAQNKDMTKEDACKLLGTCADDTVAAAEAMRAQCVKMMDAGKALLDKGMQIKTRGQMWGDKAMAAEGDGMIARGQKMIDEAKKMDEQCKIMIDEAKKAKVTAEEMKKQGDKKQDSKKDEPKL